MDWIEPILLMLCGVLAASGLIISKKPSAAELIGKLTPYQAFMGVVLFAWSLYWWIYVGIVNVFRALGAGLLGITAFGMIFSGLILGFFFGMPQIAKWIPGESSAEVKAVELSKKIAPFQVIFGIAGIVFGLLALLYNLRILKP